MLNQIYRLFVSSYFDFFVRNAIKEVSVVLNEKGDILFLEIIKHENKNIVHIL